MEQAQHEELDTFIEETREAFRSHTDPRKQAEKVTAATEGLMAADEWMEEVMDFDGRRARAELYLDDEYGYPDSGFVVKGSITHPEEPTGGSTPHDHGATWVVYGVYRGKMEQYRYGWEYDANARNPKLDEQAKFVQQPGDALFLLPGEIHRTNIVNNEPTWVVRVESQHLDAVTRHRYNLGTNSIGTK